jgi:hypothetical protein
MPGRVISERPAFNHGAQTSLRFPDPPHKNLRLAFLSAFTHTAKQAGCRTRRQTPAVLAHLRHPGALFV